MKLILAEATNTYELRSEHDYSDIKEYPIIICGCDRSVLDMAVDLSNKYGLLISDATHLAVIKSEGISNIATNDTDFQRLNEIDIYKP